MITYYNQQTIINYQELGELQRLVTLHSMNTSVRMGLFALEVAGVTLGFISFKKRNVKIGLFGMGLCVLSLIFLYPA